MIKQRTEVSINRIAGDPVNIPMQFLVVENVFNASKMIRLKYNGIDIEVHSDELLKAIDNATNNEVLK
jgi:hypothetical protein